MIEEADENRALDIPAVFWGHTPASEVMHFPSQRVEAQRAFDDVMADAAAALVTSPHFRPKDAVLFVSLPLV